MIMICGADWCGDTRRTLAYFDDQGVAYTYRNVDTDSGAMDWVEAQNDGKRKLPTVMIGEQVLSVPTNAQIDDALRSQGAMS
ncbi:MAG: glutaredoxin family protein [Gemmataceae bacterium]|nr:glutaredoxin family protein [Gemmataceae bacterium]